MTNMMKSWRTYWRWALKKPSAIPTLEVKVIQWSWLLKQDIKLIVINWKGKVTRQTAARGMKKKKNLRLLS